jgi:hypothetical protein
MGIIVHNYTRGSSDGRATDCSGKTKSSVGQVFDSPPREIHAS